MGMITRALEGAEKCHKKSDATTSVSFYRPELDILRFCAFAAVYVTHSLSHDPAEYLRFHLPKVAAKSIAAIAEAGRFGVTLFFLLSAYLITSLLLREKATTGDVNLKSFYVRRILRIWPLYFLALTLAAVMPLDGRFPVTYLIGYLLLAGNWMSAILGPPHSWASVLWSVSIEEQFYLSWPHAVKTLSFNALLGTGIGLIAIANLTRIALYITSVSADAVSFNTFAQLDSIGAGILCALAFRTHAARFRPAIRWLLVCVGIGLLVSCGRFEPIYRAFIVFGYPCATAGCLSLFLAVSGLSISFRSLVYLGKISYGLYAYHMLALSLMGLTLGGRANTLLRFVIYWVGGLMLTIALASISYRLLERPFLRLKERFAVVKSRPV
jgi:peptidoglycan/LPS O-acetylase OafA/YrhL